MIVLLRRDHLVAGRQIDTVLQDLERLAGVARDGQLLRIAAELRGETAANRLDVAIHQTGVVDGRQVLHVEVALDGIRDDSRMRAMMPGVQVDQRPIERERLLHFTPVAFVARDVLRRLAPHGPRRRGDVLDGLRADRERGGAEHAGRAQERSSSPHGHLRCI